MAKKRKKKKGSLLVRVLVCIVILLAAAVGLLLAVSMVYTAAPSAPPAYAPEPAAAELVPPVPAPEPLPPAETTAPETEPPTPPPSTAPEQPHAVSTARILSTGDLLMHGQLITDARISDDMYDFSYIFPKAAPYIQAADLSVANLETTLAGPARVYQGNPMFNCPDNIVESAKNAGFDILLTANNHSYDSQQPGYDRTIQTVRSYGLENLGTMLSGEEPKYRIFDVNGIHVGMICYTYEDSQVKGNYPYLNYNPMSGGSYNIINCFRKTDREPFYAEIGEYLSQMRRDGADVTMVYIHWGEEYQLTPVAHQTEMAQRLCDMGVDVIVGGHPHVIEPLVLLSGTQDPEHKTICLYSTGNAVSNQRLGKISSIGTAHTEDGIFFSVTFARYSDGNVYVEDVDVLPTWVRAIDRNANTVVRDSATITSYEILPLDDSRRSEWNAQLGINDSTFQQCAESWQRTMDLTGQGLADIRSWIQSRRASMYGYTLQASES